MSNGRYIELEKQKGCLDCSLIAGKHGWLEVIGNVYENKELLI